MYPALVKNENMNVEYTVYKKKILSDNLGVKS